MAHKPPRFDQINLDGIESTPFSAAPFVMNGEHGSAYKALAASGWRSPDTYSDHYEMFCSGPAVYMFSVSDDWAMGRFRVVYVGQSTRLRQRQGSHETYRAIVDHLRPDQIILRWFYKSRADALRETERALIKTFDPAFNVIHKPLVFQ